MKANSRDIVLDAARRLFAERGYPSVTIRQIAAESGLSASMVMKVGGSKAKLYEDAAPSMPPPFDPTIPRSQVGEAWAQRILDRRQSGAAEPWVQAVFRTADAPDPQAERDEFRAWALEHVTPLIAPGDELESRVELLACLVIGLAIGLRTQRLLADTDDEWIVRNYGRLIQMVSEGSAKPGSSESSSS